MSAPSPSLRSPTPSSTAPHSPHGAPEQPYQTKRGCLIMLAVFGTIIALTIGAMLVTGMLSGK